MVPSNALQISYSVYLFTLGKKLVYLLLNRHKLWLVFEEQFIFEYILRINFTRRQGKERRLEVFERSFQFVQLFVNASPKLKLLLDLRMRGGSVCIPPPSSETDSPLAAAAHRQ